MHVSTKAPKGDSKAPKVEKEREREAWDSGGPTIPDVATAVQPYNTAIQELEVGCGAAGRPALGLTSWARGAVCSWERGACSG